MKEYNPKTKHPNLTDLEYQYEAVADLWAGTEAMRDAGVKYLPKAPNEAKENYESRLSKAVLYPAYRDAITTTVGKIHTQEIEVTNANPLLQVVLDDLDEDQNSLDTFAKFATESSLHYGCSYILVDYPVMNNNATLADEREAGAQPYWVLLHAPEILEASPVKQGGKNKLGIFRFKETEAFRTDEFTVSYRDRVKEFRLDGNSVIYRVFIKQQGKWVVSDEGTIDGVSEIPVAPIYSNKVGYYLGAPLFYDLAEENILNWQIQSDYQNVLHMTSVPMLKMTGVAPQFDNDGTAKEITISPNTIFDIQNPDADISWVEVSGTAVESSRQAILDSHDRMDKLSLQSLTGDPNGSTATENMLRAEESKVIIDNIAGEVTKGLEKAIDLTYQYLLTQNPGTTLSINTTKPEQVVSDNEFNNGTDESNA